MTSRSPQHACRKPERISPLLDRTSSHRSTTAAERRGAKSAPACWGSQVDRYGARRAPTSPRCPPRGRSTSGVGSAARPRRRGRRSWPPRKRGVASGSRWSAMWPRRTSSCWSSTCGSRSPGTAQRRISAPTTCSSIASTWVSPRSSRRPGRWARSATLRPTSRSSRAISSRRKIKSAFCSVKRPHRFRAASRCTSSRWCRRCRPDCRRHSSSVARTGVAKAEFFPTLSLTALLGTASSGVSPITGASTIWAGTGVFSGPLFNVGRTLGFYRASIAQWEQAKLQYEQAVLTALREVSDALTALGKLNVAETGQDRSVKALTQAVEHATARYRQGLANYFEVLEAQQQLYPAQNTLAQIRRDRLLSHVRLYKALGGGWSLTDAQWKDQEESL